MQAEISTNQLIKIRIISAMSRGFNVRRKVIISGGERLYVYNAVSCLPQLLQNRASIRLAVPHCVQNIPDAL